MILDVKQGEESLALTTSSAVQLGAIVLESNSFQSKDQKFFSQPQVIPAKINIYRQNYVKITSNTPFDGVLVLTDTNFPGWEAYINGQKTPIYSANYLFRGVKLSHGTNMVEFKYKPKFLNTAIFISLGTFITVLLITLKKLIKLPIFNKTNRLVSTIKPPKFGH